MGESDSVQVHVLGGPRVNVRHTCAPPIDFEQIDLRNFLMIFAYINQHLVGWRNSAISYSVNTFFAVILRSDHCREIWDSGFDPPPPLRVSLSQRAYGEHSPLPPLCAAWLLE